MRDVSFACVKPLSIVTKSELGLPDCFNRFAVNCFMVQIRDSYHFGGMKILSSFGMVLASVRTVTGFIYTMNFTNIPESKRLENGQKERR